jgi:hypothetical protein
MKGYPTLTTYVVQIDPAGDGTYTFKPTTPYLIIDLDAPNVAREKVQAVVDANLTMYERAVARFIGSQYEYDLVKNNTAEPRVLGNLDSLQDAFAPGDPYLLGITVLEFRQS